VFRFFRSKKRGKNAEGTGSKPKKCNNLNNIRRETRIHLRSQRKGYLEAKLEEFETNSEVKSIRDLYRGISDFKKSYQHRSNMVKDEKVDLVTDSHSISSC
jgi:hypothetical protein